MKLFSYKPLVDYIYQRGISINTLKKEGVITDYAAQCIRDGRSVSMEHIAKICRYLNVPIDDVVEVIYED